MIYFLKQSVLLCIILCKKLFSVENFFLDNSKLYKLRVKACVTHTASSQIEISLKNSGKKYVFVCV